MIPLTDQEVAALRCPRCTGPVRMGDGVLACPQCAGVYSLRSRGADLLPWSGGDPGPEWARWRKKLDLLQEWRRSTWDGSCASDVRQKVADDLADDFFLFLGLPGSGTVLDIGCGGGDLRALVPTNRYWGLDPAPATSALEGDPEAVILRGVGERLPVADSFFDAVLLCQTLDHCLDPAKVVGEARRVLKPGGILGVMQSLRTASPAPQPPLAVRIRVGLGHLKSRLLGRNRVDDADTKTVPLDRAEVIALVQSVTVLDACLVQGQVVFLRSRRVDATMTANTDEMVRA